MTQDHGKRKTMIPTKVLEHGPYRPGLILKAGLKVDVQITEVLRAR